MADYCRIVANIERDERYEPGKKIMTPFITKAYIRLGLRVNERDERDSPRACAREYFNFSINRKYSLAHIYPPVHTVHPVHIRILRGLNHERHHERGALLARAPRSYLFLFLKNMKKYCGKENINEFRGELKAAAPDFYNLAKGLYNSGMISGLRSATLEIGDFTDTTAIEIKEPRANTVVCEECEQWLRDKIGDGTGIGKCLLNVKPTQIKWPQTPSCNKFAVKLSQENNHD